MGCFQRSQSWEVVFSEVLGLISTCGSRSQPFGFAARVFWVQDTGLWLKQPQLLLAGRFGPSFHVFQGSAASSASW